MAKTCVFCGSADKLTREHVFGDWLGSIGLNQEPAAHRAGPLNSKPRDLGVTPPFKSTVRDVCAACNNGWMSRLEAAAARVLPPLILDRPGLINPIDQGIIAAWVQKTALVNMLVSSSAERANGYGLPRSEYQALYENRGLGGPLSDSQGWIGRYGGTRTQASACVTPMVIRLNGTPDPDRPQAYITTIVLGRLVIQLIRFTTPLSTVHLATSERLVEFWPSGRAVGLPADSAVDDRELIQFERGSALKASLRGVSLSAWRPATEMQESVLQDGMVKMPVPCGRHFIAYPAILAAMGMRGISHAFVTACECGDGYLIETELDGAHVKLGGAPEVVAQAYARIPAPEFQVEDVGCEFVCKRLTS